MGNIIVGVFVVGLLLFVFSIFLDKVSLTEKIGHVILSETSIEIFQSNESKLIQNVDLDKVSLKPGIESPLGYKRLASYPTLLLILNLKNNQTIKLHLSNQANNFDSIDKYLAKLNRLGVKIKV